MCFLCFPGSVNCMFFCFPGSPHCMFSCFPGSFYCMFFCFSGSFHYMFFCFPGSLHCRFFCFPGSFHCRFSCFPGTFHCMVTPNSPQVKHRVICDMNSKSDLHGWLGSMVDWAPLLKINKYRGWNSESQHGQKFVHILRIKFHTFFSLFSAHSFFLYTVQLHCLPSFIYSYDINYNTITVKDGTTVP